MKLYVRAMARNAWSLDGRTVLITGAARGIGGESAKLLAKRGARLSLLGLEPELLEQTAAECGDAVWFECDVTDTEALEQAVAGTVERFGGIDCVIANAGTAPYGTVLTIDPAAFERTIEINLLGAWRTVRASLPHVIERRGYVLAIASAAAAFHAPMMAPYAASKAGIEAFCDSLRLEVAHLGVDVGVGYFTFMDTNLVSAASQHPAFEVARAGMPKPLAKTYPLSLATEAVARGVERRSDQVVAPRFLRTLIKLRGFRGLLDRQVRNVAPDVVRAAEKLAAERGAREASLPDDPAARAPFESSGTTARETVSR
jgi:NAD(P)-dependent dehydrogenase (short-subunit alcohol dehydrogenase family)